MQVLRLPIHPSLRGRVLPRPTRSTHRLPNPTDTALGHHASVQTTTRLRRALITGRTILTPVGTTIPTRVFNRGARPRTRFVPAAPMPRLVAATLVGKLADAPRRRRTRRSSQASPCDPSAAEVFDRSESGPGGRTARGWPSQPGPQYSPRESQGPSETKEPSSPRSPGWREGKHGEAAPVDDPGGADHPRAMSQNRRFAAPRRTPTPTGPRQTRGELKRGPEAPPPGPPRKTPGSSTPRRRGGPG